MSAIFRQIWYNLNVKKMIFYLTWISIFAGGTLVLLLLLSLLGGLDLDVDTDFSSESDTDGGGGLGVIKGILTFVSIGSWAMKIFIMSETTTALALALGITSGLVAVFLLHFMMKTLMNNDENVNWNSDDAILQLGEVYLKIPASDGNGIVNVNIKGARREMKAKSYENTEIKTGAKVRVIEVVGDFALVKEENI